MFTGIIEELGRVVSSSLNSASGQLQLAADLVLADCRIGDSIAVNGVCLTVTAIHTPVIDFDVSLETLRRSNLGRLKPGDQVNLERALPAAGRFGGHIVSGHIDATGVFDRRRREGNAEILGFTAPAEVARYLVEKGSIAIDGISLTIAALNGNSFTVAAIPHTLAATTLGRLRPGAQVNLEVDLIAKYVEKLLEPKPSGGLDIATLKRNGFA